ncbi:MAG: hypothetical protein JW995_14370 [Melioribacteraceae bacterium]|nr:hypothetical protein [Melioribacteraceae bacterium]
MKNYKDRIQLQLPVFMLALFFITAMQTDFAQRIKWLRVSDLQSFVSEIGAEYEGQSTTGNTNYFSWPAQYSIDQNTARMKGLWIGAKNFDDPVENKEKGVKVIGSGPRDGVDRVNQIFPTYFKLVGRDYHPNVIVDDQKATLNDVYDLVDSIDASLPSDRMVIVKFHTSMGITVTKKVMVFTSQNHGNYFINDYEFENTGIYNAAGDVKEQTLQDVWFYFIYRYAFAGVTSSGWGSTWGAFESTWGNSTLNHAFGQDPAADSFTNPSSDIHNMRGFYSYYGPSKERTAVTYDEDWGCPNEAEDGLLGSAKYAGCVTLHADISPSNNADDLFQPRTTWFISSDINIMLADVSQYDEIFMDDRFTAMSEGHPEQQHDEIVGDNYPINYSDPRRQSGGGTSQGQGYGPYTLAHGEKVHIVFAEGVSGISWEKAREVGDKWLKWRNSSASPELVKPDGSTTTDHNEYKNEWVFTGRDSIIQTYRNAINNFKSGYTLPQPPPAPDEFVVTSGGDRIKLEWSDNAESHPHFDGYVIYRSEGSVLDYNTRYQKIFECDASDAVNSFDDLTAARGFDYYYYIQSKDDGTQNQAEPGKPLYSGMFWTITSIPANLQRPAGSFLSELRVVPNPYDIRARVFQFGDESQYDRIAFYGLPPVCDVKIYTERGDLIWETDHDDGTGDELWDSKTKYGQIVVSGIYILYVEVTEDTYAAEDKYSTHDILDDDLKVIFRTGDLMYRQGDLIYRKGESNFRKFVIIR